jgi:hypothetical protein
MPDKPELENLLLSRPAPPQHPMIVSAINLMSEGDRPTVPVKTYDNPDRLFEEVLKRFGNVKLSKNAVGVVPIDKSAIYINSNSKEFKNPYMLASKLRHEQTHVLQPKVESWRESPAYQNELQFVDNNQGKFTNEYRALLLQELQRAIQRENNVRK